MVAPPLVPLLLAPPVEEEEAPVELLEPPVVPDALRPANPVVTLLVHPAKLPAPIRTARTIVSRFLWFTEGKANQLAEPPPPAGVASNAISLARTAP